MFLQIEKSPINVADKMRLIAEYLTNIPSAKTAAISKVIGTSDRRAGEILKAMIDDGIIKSDGSRKTRIYMLKRD